jgi:hypothetical protein
MLGLMQGVMRWVHIVIGRGSSCRCLGNGHDCGAGQGGGREGNEGGVLAERKESLMGDMIMLLRVFGLRDTRREDSM